MANKKNVFSENVELSELVLSKTNQAFAQIQKEDNDFMEKKYAKNKRLWKTRAAAAAGLCILAAGSISAAAAIRHYWGRGMNGNLLASDMQQQSLMKQDAAKVYSESEMNGDPSLAVTNNGITIEPDTVVVDERFAYLSFRISGFVLGEGIEPGFDAVNTYVGDDPEDESGWINMNGKMYDGIVPDENGSPVYEDGTPLESEVNGAVIARYADSKGDMEYIMQASIAGSGDSLLGKTLHVDFKNLGTLLNAEFTTAVEGNWNFKIDLPAVSSSQNITMGQNVEGTDFTMESIDISPISMKVNYSASAASAASEDELVIPEVKGVVLKDGTRIPYLIDGSACGYTDGSKTGAYQIAGYDRVLEVETVAALIVRTAGEKIEIPVTE